MGKVNGTHVVMEYRIGERTLYEGPIQTAEMQLLENGDYQVTVWRPNRHGGSPIWINRFTVRPTERSQAARWAHEFAESTQD